MTRALMILIVAYGVLAILASAVVILFGWAAHRPDDAEEWCE